MADLEKFKQEPIKRGLFLQQVHALDKFLCAVGGVILFFGLIIVITSSPAIARKLHLDTFYFVKRHLFYLFTSICIITLIALMPVKYVKRLAILGFIVSIAALVFVLFKGHEVKGARRWLHFGFLSIQPSEFVKTFFTIFLAWIISIRYKHRDFPVFLVSFVPYITVLVLLILQPDFGMTVMMSLIWIGELFIGGLSIFWLALMIGTGIAGMAVSYIALPHVRTRIDLFLDPQNFENYQMRKALEAFKHGGFFGVGLGDGVVKEHIPDSHTDFIYAVIGEEMGFVACLFLIVMFLLLVARGLYLALTEHDKFNILATSGILIQIGVQAFLNIGIAMHLFPTKGMTLPFVSYGGSSLIATAISFGVLLAVTKRPHLNN